MINGMDKLATSWRYKEVKGKDFQLRVEGSWGGVVIGFCYQSDCFILKFGDSFYIFVGGTAIYGEAVKEVGMEQGKVECF